MSDSIFFDISLQSCAVTSSGSNNNNNPFCSNALADSLGHNTASTGHNSLNNSFNPNAGQPQMTSSPTTTTTVKDMTEELSAVQFIPYESLPHIIDDASIIVAPQNSVRVFLGGIRYDVDRALVARIVTHLSGNAIPINSIVIFSKATHSATKQSSGSAIVQIPSAEGAARLMGYHKRVLCEATGISIADDVRTMQQHAERVTSRHGGPHPLVVELSRNDRNAAQFRGRAKQTQQQQQMPHFLMSNNNNNSIPQQRMIPVMIPLMQQQPTGLMPVQQQQQPPISPSLFTASNVGLWTPTPIAPQLQSQPQHPMQQQLSSSSTSVLSSSSRGNGFGPSSAVMSPPSSLVPLAPAPIDSDMPTISFDEIIM
eukprot:PhM_4_TR3043/c0_g1_i1/m.45435